MPRSPAARWVIHLDLDAFYASAEQLTRPTLRGRPVVVGGTGPRGVVAGASYESRVHGVRSAMPMSQARRLLPASGVVLPPRFRLYEELSRRVFAVVVEFAPVLERVSLDEAFAEPPALAGADEQAVRDWVVRLRERIRAETGLVASVGAGAGKQVAKIGSGEAKPDGYLVVAQGTEREFLADLPVRTLWGVGPVAEEKLRVFGVQTIGQLAALSEQDAAAMLGGAVGRELRLLAAGTDDRPVAERGEAKQVSAETTFDVDVRDLATLRARVAEIAEKAHERLARSGRAARTVSIKLRHTDMSTISRSETTRDPSLDLAALSETAERLLPDPAEFGAVRLAGVAFSGLTELRQEPLFQLAVQSTDSTRAPAPPPSTIDTVDGAAEPVRRGWRAGDDVTHTELGSGWVQGAGYGRVTVRFETRTSGPGRASTFDAADPALRPGEPLDGLR